ncbi:hypothetical protein BVC80_6941g2 [Macleaya cordata]|uniref:Uncharacterized protein n=1 Tax=Macleaya cordata TaxID=56857 RepID=A0A200Q868_MACCD|nr:hypothetical protein BVC80_6941g2 [Macleaya cordata]
MADLSSSRSTDEYQIKNFSSSDGFLSSSSFNTTNTTVTDNGFLSISINGETDNTHFIREKITSLDRVEDGLARARAAIRKAVRTRNYTSHREEDFIPTGSIYRNPYAFHQLRSKQHFISIFIDFR